MVISLVFKKLSATYPISLLCWALQLCKCGCSVIHWVIGLLPHHSN